MPSSLQVRCCIFGFILFGWKRSISVNQYITRLNTAELFLNIDWCGSTSTLYSCKAKDSIEKLQNVFYYPVFLIFIIYLFLVHGFVYCHSYIMQFICISLTPDDVDLWLVYSGKVVGRVEFLAICCKVTLLQYSHQQEPDQPSQQSTGVITQRLR